MLGLHSADMHLGFQQYGFAERGDDFQAAAEFVFADARRLRVKYMIIAGDQFQTTKPSADMVSFLQRQVQAARADGITVLGIDGNHDKTDNEWLKVCGIAPLENWSKADPDAHLIPVLTTVEDNGAKLAIFGIDGHSPTTVRLRLDDIERSGVKFDILVMHTEITELCGYASTGLAASEVVYKLRNSGCKLVLLGHIHNYTEAVIGDTRFIYSGSTELWSRDEKPDKSYSLIESTTVGFKTAYCPIPVRQQLDAYISTQDDLDQLLARIDAASGQTERQPMVLARYNPEVPGMGKKIESLLDGRALFITIPQSRNTAAASNPMAQLTKDAFDRKGAMRGMGDVLNATFGSGSDETALVLQMLAAPNNVQDVILRYAKEKGLSIR